MPGTINILLLESDSNIRQQIRDSLTAGNLAFKIKEVTVAELHTVTSGTSPYAFFIYSNKEIPPEMLPTLYNVTPELICLLDENETGETEQSDRARRGIRTIAKNPGEINEISEIIKKAVCHKNQQILSEFLYNENQIRLIGNLLSGVAHNISAPLTGILGYAEIIRSLQPELTEIEHVINQARRIDTILRSLVFKNMKLQEKEAVLIDLNDLIKSEISFLQANLVFKHEISKKFEYADNLPHFLALYSAVSHCVASIVTFCIEATKNSSQREIRLKTDFDSDYVLMELGYCGLPFPVEDLAGVASDDNLIANIFASDHLEDWLNQNFNIYLAYNKLISLQAKIETRRGSNDEEIIVVKFPRKTTQHVDF